LKTLSAQATPALVERVEALRQEEGQTASQVVLQAVDFWTRLPAEAHLAIRRLAAADRVDQLVQRVLSEALDLQFQLASQRVATTMQLSAEVDASLPTATDDELLATADAALGGR
jgi:hypothetical protein